MSRGIDHAVRVQQQVRTRRDPVGSRPINKQLQSGVRTAGVRRQAATRALWDERGGRVALSPNADRSAINEIYTLQLQTLQYNAPKARLESSTSSRSSVSF